MGYYARNEDVLFRDKPGAKGKLESWNYLTGTWGVYWDLRDVPPNEYRAISEIEAAKMKKDPGPMQPASVLKKRKPGLKVTP